MKNFKIIFMLLIIFSVCLVSCNKKENTQVNNEVSNIEQENINQDVNKEKIAFNSEKTNVKFEYSNEFSISNIEEVKAKLSENNINVPADTIKEILVSSKNEIVLVAEEENSNQETLEQLKEQYNELSKYEELQIKVEKNEIIKKDNQEVLCVVMSVQENKMQIVTAFLNEKTVTIQYMSSIDNYDSQNAQIILDSVSI